MIRIYVMGGQGQVARSLREAAARDDLIVLGCGERPDVDLLRPALVERALDAFRPDVVVNPAAYTAVDKAEAEPDLAGAPDNRVGERARCQCVGPAICVTPRMCPAIIPRPPAFWRWQ